MPELAIVAELNKHRTTVPIDHPDQSVTRTKLEYPTVDVNLAYLYIIGKAFLDLTDGNRFTFVGTVDNFTDKAIMNGQLMKSAESYFYEGFFGRAQADPRTDVYLARIDTSFSTADVRLEKLSAGTSTTLGTQAVDLSDDTNYIFGISCSGSTIKYVRFDRWTVSTGAISFGTATVAASATDTSFSAGRFLDRTSNVGGPGDTTHGLLAWLKAPYSALPSSVAIIEVETIGSGTLEDPFRPKLSQNLSDIPDNAPNFLKLEKKKYDVLKAKGFTDEEIKLLLGYIPQTKVDLNSVTWGTFEFSEKSATNIIVVYGDNPYRAGAIEKQKAVAKRVFKPPTSYDEAVALYNQLGKDYPHWLAGKDNFAYQALGFEELESLAAIDFYYGELVEHKTHYDQIKQVPDWELRNTLKMWSDRLEKAKPNLPPGEYKKHKEKLDKVLKLGW